MSEINNPIQPTVEELVNVIQELFSLDDEFLVNQLPAMMMEVEKNLTGPKAMQAMDEAIKAAELEGISIEEFIHSVEYSKQAMFELFLELKEQYSDSEMRLETLDMLYSLLENYFNTFLLRMASRDTVNMAVELTGINAKIPTYAHPGDQGADIYAAETVEMPPYTYGKAISTGIKMMIPEGWVVSIRPRSGLSKNTTLRISNSPATIDQQYRGEIKVLMDNIGPSPITINAGDRIAQMVLERNYQMNFHQVDSISEATERGSGGFGSSGN